MKIRDLKIGEAGWTVPWIVEHRRLRKDFKEYEVWPYENGPEGSATLLVVNVEGNLRYNPLAYLKWCWQCRGLTKVATENGYYCPTHGAR